MSLQLLEQSLRSASVCQQVRSQIYQGSTYRLVTVLFFPYAAAQQSCSYYGDVRLIGGSNEREGRVEVCIGKVWGTVCSYGWSSSDARVVCRQLGFEVDVPRGCEFFFLFSFFSSIVTAPQVERKR